MSATTLPPPIPGERIDPPPKAVVKTLRQIEERSRTAGIGYRAFLRFSLAKASLLAAGTTYYVFLSIFALVTLAFGLTALIGAERVAQAVTEALNQAFPGMVGTDGINAEQLRSIGQTTSILGLVVLMYSGSGAMVAASNSLHQIYGAPPDGRNFAFARVRLLGWLLIIAPLILLSFAPSILITAFAQPAMAAVGFDGGVAQALLIGLTALLSLALSLLIVYLLLGVIGGIRPERHPRLVGAVVGGIGIEILKYLMTSIVAWSVSKPQYGAFAAPIAVLFVLYLQSIILYGSASLTAGIAEKDEPLDDEYLSKQSPADGR